MSQAVDHVLERRSRRGGRPEAVSLAAAVLLHGGAVALIVLLPRLAPPPPPLSFVPVQIVPVQALGVRRPASRPKAEKPAPPEPEPVKPEPEKPAPQPPAKDVPVLPAEKPEKKKPEPKPPPESATGTNPAGTAAQPNLEGEAGRRGSAAGNPLGSAAFGSAIAGLDNPDFKFGFYIDQLLSAIDGQWVRPPLGDGVRAIISFRIERDGSLSDLQVAESSGYNSFDLAALRAVQNAAPFAPLPRAYRRGSLGVNLIVR
ncbi:MAG TPA: TonB family protein [Thermoanaerobaculia bacterium]|nr:TonB family protein [Thermoanaerobaculia bacterium]